MRVLVLGSNGMLGRAAYSYFSERNYKVIASTKKENPLDPFGNQESLENILTQLNPGLIINCVGIVSIDRCEEDFKNTSLVNEIYPGKVATWASKHNIKYVHISTDHYYFNCNNICIY